MSGEACFTVPMYLSGAVGAVLELVAKHPSRPLLIALDGASAAGTSTLAAAVGLRLSASVAGGDDLQVDGAAVGSRFVSSLARHERHPVQQTSERRARHGGRGLF
jgi:adenylylsulfate kinase-like enzyme